MTRGFVLRYLPLAGHMVPTLVIAYAWVIPHSCIAGWNSLSVGFGLSVLSTVITYVLGQRAAVSCARNRSCRVA